MAYKDKGILWVIATLYLTEMLRRFRTEDLEISYGVATVSRRLKMIGLFGRISSVL